MVININVLVINLLIDLDIWNMDYCCLKMFYKKGKWDLKLICVIYSILVLKFIKRCV